jgi:hypothetical protein
LRDSLNGKRSPAAGQRERVLFIAAPTLAINGIRILGVYLLSLRSE